LGERDDLAHERSKRDAASVDQLERVAPRTRGRGVAARHRQLAVADLVERKLDGPAGEADLDDAATARDALERERRAGRAAAAPPRDVGLDVERLAGDRRRAAELARLREPGLVAGGAAHVDGRAARSRDLRREETDRAGPDDERQVAVAHHVRLEEA